MDAFTYIDINHRMFGLYSYDGIYNFPKNIPNVCAVIVGKYIILTVEHYKMTENMSI